MDAKNLIACRVAQELKDGDVVNLGIGLPTLIPDYLPEGVRITLQSENGFLGMGPLNGEVLPDLVNAGGKPPEKPAIRTNRANRAIRTNRAEKRPPSRHLRR